MKEVIIDHELSDEEFDKLWEKTMEMEERETRMAQKKWDALSDEEKKEQELINQMMERFWENPLGDD